MAGGVFWIVVVGVLLAGVVAINVAVLRLNVRMDELSHQRAQLRAENAALEARLASLAASFRIEKRARTRLGLVLADPEQTEYLRLK